jgi:hypothetical protein
MFRSDEDESLPESADGTKTARSDAAVKSDEAGSSDSGDDGDNVTTGGSPRSPRHTRRQTDPGSTLECGLSAFAVGVLVELVRALVRGKRLDMATQTLKLVRRVATAPPDDSPRDGNPLGSNNNGGVCRGANDGDGSGTPAEWRCCYACRNKYLGLVSEANVALAEAMGTEGFTLHGVGLPDD